MLEFSDAVCSEADLSPAASRSWFEETLVCTKPSFNVRISPILMLLLSEQLESSWEVEEATRTWRGGEAPPPSFSLAAR